MKRLSWVLSASLLLGGCGYKGRLQLPEDARANKPAASAESSEATTPSAMPQATPSANSSGSGTVSEHGKIWKQPDPLEQIREFHRRR